MLILPIICLGGLGGYFPAPGGLLYLVLISFLNLGEVITIRLLYEEAITHKILYIYSLISESKNKHRINVFVVCN